MISGGSCRSPSSSTTASPVAACIPLVNAPWEPKLRLWLMTRTLGSISASFSRTSRALSGLASLTKMIS